MHKKYYKKIKIVKAYSFYFHRDIVKASHLKPLDKEDRLTDVKFVQPWNNQASKKTENADKPDSAEIPKVCPQR